MNELQLELSSYCNSRCTMCLKGQDKRQFGHMSFDLAKRIINEANVKNLKASWFGEPLLNPEFKKIIRYAHDKGMRIFLFTNGSLIDKDMADFLISYTDRIFISIDDVDEHYEKIRIGLKYSDVDRAIKLLGSHDIILTAVKTNEDQEKRLRERYPEYPISFARYVNRYKKNETKKGIACMHNVNGRLVVGWDGRCYLCCEDWLGKYKIGDLNKSSISEVWNGKKRLNYIKHLNELNICKNCTV